MENLTKFIIPGIIFLPIASGIWLSRLGKPYQGALFNVHKLVALGAVVVVIIRLAGVFKTANALALVIALLILAALCVIALFATGALMSMGKLNYTLMLIIHQIASALIVLATTMVAYLLRDRL